MGDEDFVPCEGGYVASVGRLGYLGHVTADGIRLSSDDDDKPSFGLFEPVEETFTLSVPWYAANRLRRLLILRKYVPAYTVRRLRQGKKSHRGKEIAW